MSVTFQPALDSRGTPLVRCACAADGPPCPACRMSVNLNNRNAADLIEWLGLKYSGNHWGCVKAIELVALCQRRLWPEARNTDEGLPVVHHAPNVIEAGRDAGYLRERTEQLLKIALMAGDHWVCWS